MDSKRLSCQLINYIYNRNGFTEKENFRYFAAQLPNIDDVVTREDACGALESVKAASELYSPVSGLYVHYLQKLDFHWKST